MGQRVCKVTYQFVGTIKNLWLLLGTSASAAGSRPVKGPFCWLNYQTHMCNRFPPATGLVGRRSSPHALPSL